MVPVMNPFEGIAETDQDGEVGGVVDWHVNEPQHGASNPFEGLQEVPVDASPGESGGEVSTWKPKIERARVDNYLSFGFGIVVGLGLLMAIVASWMKGELTLQHYWSLLGAPLAAYLWGRSEGAKHVDSS